MIQRFAKPDWNDVLRIGIRWLVLVAFVSASAGTASALFLHSLDWVTSFRESNLWLLALLPVGGLAVGLAYHYWGTESQGGSNLIISRIRHPDRGLIPWLMAPLVYLGTLVTHFFGGSAGREGTAVQMAVSLADRLKKPMNLTANDREIVLRAAVAAGFSSVFGTPIAGAVFALEFTRDGRWAWRSWLPIAAAALGANAVGAFWHAPHTDYTIAFVPAFNFSVLVYSAVAGGLFAAASWIFSSSLSRVAAIFQRFISYAPLRPAAGGLAVLALTYAVGNPNYLGLGVPTIVASFEGAMAPYDFAWKLVFTVVTLSSGFKGGEVTPLFFIGATLGSALSLWIPLPVGLLAGMGFVAVFAGATKTPIASTLMSAELFGPEALLPMAIACSVAALASGRTGIYRISA